MQRRDRRPGLLRRRQLLQLRGRDAGRVDRWRRLCLRPAVLCRFGQQGHGRPLVQRFGRRDLDVRALQHPELALRHHRRHAGRDVGRAVQAALGVGHDDGRQRRLRVHVPHRQPVRRRARLSQPLVPALQRPQRRRERDDLPAPHDARPTRSNVAQQRNTNGENSFALYASATGGTPRIYGLGAMQMFTPLSASGGSTFSRVLPRPDRGRPRRARRWRSSSGTRATPTRCRRTSRSEIPTSTGWSPTNFSWTSAVGTGASGTASCDGDTGPNVSSVTTANRDLGSSTAAG